MGRRRVLAMAAAAAAVALLPLPVMPAGAATTEPSLATWTTISGANSYVDVHLDRFAPINSALDEHSRPGYMQIQGDPGAIVVLMSMDVVHGHPDAPWIPIIKLPAVGGHRVAYWHVTGPGLAAGDYRVFLIARRQTTVRFYVPGQTTDATQLSADVPTHAAQSVVTDAKATTDRAAHQHENSLFFTVHRRAMAFGTFWTLAPKAPLARFDTACTYVDDPVGGRTLPGCPGAILVWDEDFYPFTRPFSWGGYAVGPDPAGRTGVAAQNTIVGPTTAVGSAMYFFEY